MAFLIVAAVLLVINTVFLVGSLIYTLKTTTGKVDAVAPSRMDPRLSLQPQELLYQAIVRMSASPVPDIDKLDSQTKQAAS
uniref:Uncharacterized protein n=1 Tax=Heliothis virescens TaxID=7102 RepID=A0A2A4JCR4_HELVI